MAKIPLDYPITIIWSFKLYICKPKTINHVIKKENKIKLNLHLKQVQLFMITKKTMYGKIHQCSNEHELIEQIINLYTLHSNYQVFPNM